jgi:hypothetical protein
MDRKKSTTSKRTVQTLLSSRVAADSGGGSGSGIGEEFAGEREGRFVVEVTDSGAGISKANQAKLFREVRVRRVVVVW